MEKVNYEAYKVCVYKAGDLEAILNDRIYIPKNIEKYRIPHETASYMELKLGENMLTEEERKQAAQEIKSKTYEQGLADAWEAARKMCRPVKRGGMTPNDLIEIFGTPFTGGIILKNTAAEAIAKIKAYEDKQNAFKCGDVVKYKNDYKHQKFVYLYTDDNGKIARCLIYAKMIDAVVCVPMPLELLEKAGRHIPLVEELLDNAEGTND